MAGTQAATWYFHDSAGDNAGGGNNMDVWYDGHGTPGGFSISNFGTDTAARWIVVRTDFGTYTEPVKSTNPGSADYQNRGWNIPDSLMEEPGERRVIAAGTWGWEFVVKSALADLANTVYRVGVNLFRRTVSTGAATWLTFFESSAFAATGVNQRIIINPTLGELLFTDDESLHAEVWIKGKGLAITGQTMSSLFRGVHPVGADNISPSFVVPSIRTRFDRANSEVLTTAATLDRQSHYPRGQSETIPTTATIDRSVIVGRALAEVTATTADITRMIGFFRGLTDSVVTVATLDRLYHAVPSLPEATAVADVLSRSQVLARALSEAHATTANLERQINMVRAMAEYPPGVTPDWPLQFPTRAIAGVTLNAAGAPLGSVTVKLFRQSDDKLIAEQVSHPVTGAYSFVRDLLDPNTYYVVAITDDVTHGISDRNLAPA